MEVTRRAFGIGTLGTFLMAGAAVQAPSATAIPVGYDSVYYWNDVLLNAFRQLGGPPTVLSRVGAMMHLAIYDAANSVSPIGSAYVATYSKSPQKVYVLRQNIDAAALSVLRHEFSSVNFDAAAANAPRDAFTIEPGPDGFGDVGGAAAQGIINARANDGSTNNTPYQPQLVPGQWRPTPNSGSAQSPNWGLVKPFSLTRGSQFRPPPPGNFTNLTALLASPAYAGQVNEVKLLGRSKLSTRTGAQTDIAFFWANDLDGTYKPPGQLFNATKVISQARNLSMLGNVRLFALVAMALADAAIACWDSKFDTSIDLWRPETAIQMAGTDGNDATIADSAWSPLSHYTDGRSFSPPFPSYASGHATFAGAWAGIMKRYFATDSVSFTVTTQDPSRISSSRPFSSFSAAANEMALSRLYLGVHYRWDADSGLSTGDKVAKQVFTTKLL